MMEKRGNLQLELFSQSGNSSEIKKLKSNNSFLTYIWNYEKTILIIISFVITGIISFSLGVERGKKLMVLRNNSRLDVASSVYTPVPEPTPRQTSSEEKYKSATEDFVSPSYTIQLASYKTKTYAQKQAEILKKKGLLPLVLSKGNYTVLCVGRFSSKETARPLLSELKKQYRDCYLRRL